MSTHIALALLLLLPVLPLQGVAIAEEPVSVTHLSPTGWHARVSDDRVVWLDGGEVFTWTSSAGTQPITSGGTAASSPEVSGDRIVWHAPGGSDGGVDTEVFTWTPSGTEQITQNGVDDTYAEVSGDRVIWLSANGHATDLYTWTPAGTVQIAGPGLTDYENPSISGDRVVFEGRGSAYELYMWTPSGGVVGIPTNDPHVWDPEVSGDRIVWWPGTSAGGDIYTWTPSDGETRITNNLDYDAPPQVSGDRVAWEGQYAEGDPMHPDFVNYIFTWTPGDGILTVADGTIPDSQQPDVDGERIAWEADTGVFTWTPGRGVMQISDDGERVRVSGDMVVWEGRWSTSGVYVAVVPPDVQVQRTDFDMGEDSYSFGNYHGYADWDLFVDVFGQEAVDASPIGAGIYYEDQFKQLYGGGQCYGMAVTAGMFYRGVFGGDPAAFQPGATTVHSITRATTGPRTPQELDEPIERHISKYHYFQRDPARWDQVEVFYPEEADQAAAFLGAEIAAGWSDPWIWGIQGRYDAGGTYGHAVNFLGQDVYWDGRLDLFTYDNNFPDWETLFYQTSTDPTQVFSSPYEYPGIWAIILTPTALHEKDHMPPQWDEDIPSGGTAIEVFSGSIDTRTEVMHTDEQGRRLGEVAGEYVDEMPDGEVVIPVTGSIPGSPEVPTTYQLPAGDYAVELFGTSAGPEGYSLFSPELGIRVRSENPDPGTRSAIDVLQEERGYAYRSDSADKRLDATLYRDLPGAREHTLEVADVLAEPGQSLAITSTVDAEIFGVDPGGATDTCDLLLSASLESVVMTTTIESLPLDSVESLGVEPWDWEQLDSMPVFVASTMTDGTQTTDAYNTTPENMEQLLEELLASGELRNQGMMNSLLKKAENVPLHALENYLEALVQRGALSQTIADIIYASAEDLRVASMEVSAQVLE